MIKWIKVLLAGMLMSMFFFPFSFTFLPGQNTKNLIAAVGLVFAVFTFIRKGSLKVPRELIVLILISCFVSIISLFAIVYNQTPDLTYVSYYISAVIWLSSAFTVCCIIRTIHGYIDVPLLIKYLTGVCVFQCAAAMAIQFFPPFQILVDTYIDQGQWILKDMNRIYGIGASLDVAGSRFSVVLVAIIHLIYTNKKQFSVWQMAFWFCAFIIITVIGNMIARTTIIGVFLSFIYIVFLEVGSRLSTGFFGSGWKSFTAWLTVLAITIPVSVFFYNRVPLFQELMRFGFEGFFSLFEEGTWYVSSNEALKNMIIWPEELRTWIIGDGYFANSRNDPNYLGDSPVGGFYMGTDIGYLRFIYYFGVIGLLAMSAVIIWSCIFCCRYFREDRILFFLFAVTNFIIWAKVSTDLYLAFCPFMAAAMLNLDFPPDKDNVKEMEAPPE